MKLLVQRYFELWVIDWEAALVFTALILAWLIPVASIVSFFSK